MAETEPEVDEKPGSFSEESDAYFGLIIKKVKKEVWQQKVWIALYAMLTFAGAWTWLYFQTPLYEASATVLIDPKEVRDYEERRSLENLPMQTAMIYGPALLKKAMEKPGIADLPFLKGNKDPMELFRRFLDVKNDPKSSTLIIRYISADAQIAADAANAVSEAYVQSQADRGSENAKVDTKYLQVELSDNVEMQKKIGNEMAELSKKFPNIREEKAEDGRIGYREQELAKVDSELIADKTFLAGYQEFIKQGGSEQSNALMRSRPDIMKRDEEVQDARIALSLLKQKFRGQHPEVVLAQMKLDLLEEKLQTDRKLVISEIMANIKAKEAIRKKLDEEVKLLRSRDSEVTPEQLRFRQLVLEEKEILERAKTLNAKIAEASGKISRASPGVEILSVALPARAPFSPKRGKVLFIAMAFVMATSFGGIFLKYYLDKTMHSLEDLEVFIHRPSVGQIPKVKVDKGGFTPIFPKESEYLRFNNNMNFICANIRFLTEAEASKVFLLTSALMGEGKSFSVYHLALAFATDSKKVIAIDGDFCHASLSTVFSHTGAGPSLDSHLLEQAPLDQVIQKTTNPNIDFIGAGKIRKSTPNAFRSKQMRNMLAALRERYDVILIDGAPILQVNDSVALADLVDLRLLVVRAGKTPRDLVVRALNKLAPGKLVNVGILLNCVRGSGTFSYYPYYGGLT
jgi:capsular exopolysaccharide synthesis family protein